LSLLSLLLAGPARATTGRAERRQRGAVAPIRVVDGRTAWAVDDAIGAVVVARIAGSGLKIGGQLTAATSLWIKSRNFSKPERRKRWCQLHKCGTSSTADPPPP
jgi:hypothetical protein